MKGWFFGALKTASYGFKASISSTVRLVIKAIVWVSIFCFKNALANSTFSCLMPYFDTLFHTIIMSSIKAIN